MIDTKLIIIEGMAGSGKSTTGQEILNKLLEKGIKAKFYHEFDGKHPIIDYNEPDRNIWITRTTDRWKKLADRLSNDDEIIILEAAYFQCTIGELLERGCAEEETFKYAFEILDIIEPVNPALIYFYQDDIESALRRVYNSRSPKWQNKVCTFLDNTAFGRSYSLTGFDLYLEFNKSLRLITDEIFERAHITKLAIENSEPDWPAIYRKAFKFLQIQ